MATSSILSFSPLRILSSGDIPGSTSSSSRSDGGRHRCWQQQQHSCGVVRLSSASRGARALSGVGVLGGLSFQKEQQQQQQTTRLDLFKMSAGAAKEGVTRRVREPQIAVNEGKTAAVKSKNFVNAQLAKPGVKSLVIAVAIPLVLGSIDAFFNSPNSTWFKELKKPWWEPPGPIFGGAWSILYPLMGLSSWLVWADGGFHNNSTALVLYVTQLALNLLWPLFFFGWKNLSLALIDIIALIGTLGATINAFKSVNEVAANLLKPYLAWIIFAAAINFSLWIKNRGGAQPQAA